MRSPPSGSILHRAALLAGAAVLVTGLSAGQEGAPAAEGATGAGDEAAAVERGRFLYGIYCLDCHGEGGRGNGAVARERELELPDLTRLAATRGGTFPSLEVHEIIDGRVAVEGHLRREMPVWGLAFQTPDQDAVHQEEVHGRIQQLIQYLRSIQVEGAVETEGRKDENR